MADIRWLQGVPSGKFIRTSRYIRVTVLSLFMRLDLFPRYRSLKNIPWAVRSPWLLANRQSKLASRNAVGYVKYGWPFQKD